MAIRIFRRSKLAGFTLVELLIVVAIIGVLSTIGVPTFKRMIQKSKKSEAKVNLGGLYTAEQAFFAEYNAYGNRLEKVGFQTDGSDLLYVTGFPTSTCGSNTILPAVGDGAAGDQINRVFSSYYATAPATERLTIAGAVTKVSADPSGKGGVAGLGACADTIDSAAGASILAGYGGTPAVNIFNDTGASDAFIATASGVIAPQFKRTTSTAGELDVWAINSKRILSNVQDGVR